MFGITFVGESSTAECMDFASNPKLQPAPPPETAEQMITAKAMYKCSQGKVGAGQQTARQYTDSFVSTKRYGMPTPHSKEGKSMNMAMQWVNDTKAAKETPLISAAAREFSDRYTAPLGAPYEPLKDTRHPGANDEAFVFGAPKDDIHETVGTLFDGGMGSTEDATPDNLMLTTLTRETFADTQPFISTEAIDFTGPKITALEADFTELDVTRNARVTGMMDRRQTEMLLTKHDVPMDANLLPNTPMVNYKALITELEKGELRSINSSSLVQTVKTIRPCGHATIRTDLIPPRIKGVMEFRNFGNEGGVNTIYNPSAATRRGIDDHELSIGRPRAQLETIFKAAGLAKTHVFEQVYTQAQDAAGTVSFNSFQQTLDALI
jgi:hypothetical protein